MFPEKPGIFPKPENQTMLFIHSACIYHIPTRQSPCFTELTYTRKQDNKGESGQLHESMIHYTSLSHSVMSTE